jgi:hypothetical protein
MQFGILGPTVKMHAVECDVVGFFGKTRRIGLAVTTCPCIVQTCQKRANGILVHDLKLSFFAIAAHEALAPGTHGSFEPGA